MLRAVHGNRVEALLEALIDGLPPADPFAPATIVVGSHLVARWLHSQIAFARGIATGLELVTFDRFVERVWATDGLIGLDRRRLAAAIASVLADATVVQRLPPVAAYLAGDVTADDRAAPRRVQLAERLAELAWQYAQTRPDWMPALVEGHVPGELAGHPSARWQASLLGAALQRLPARAAPVPMLPWLRRREGLPPPQVPPVATFGLSFLARAQLEALTDLASTSDVTVYVLDPCEELWDDVAGRAAVVAGCEDPLPLVLWGRPVRDTLAALVERTGGDVEGRFAVDAPVTARERLLADVRARRLPSGEPAGEAGVAVLACPNARREVEVIAAEVRRLLDGDATLAAHEIGVWVAGDAEHYLAQAPAAFEAVGVPCHLVDAPIDDRGRIGEAVLALLELPTGTMARRELLRVMTHPAVLARHPHVDAADWVRWTERLGIVHGADASAHKDTYLEAYPGHFHWDQGVRRLALGAFMRAGPGAQIAGLPVAPEEVRADQLASAATYALLVRSLCADAAWLATLVAPLARWGEVLAGLVDTYLAPRDAEAVRDIERVRALLAGVAALDVDGRAVGFREAREHVVRMLATTRANRGEPLASGVMIAPLAAMRAVPFRVAFVAGLDEGAFPAGEQPLALDLRREPRRGDVTPRDRDRSAFLDVLLCARARLYLSYVAIEQKSGQALGPSSVVLELADALAPYLGAASTQAALAAITVRYPLHRFGQVPRERWACEVRDALRAHLRRGGHPIPDEEGQLALLAHAAQQPLRMALGIEPAPAAIGVTAVSRPLAIANLRAFLEYPIQAWAQAVLGLEELPDDAALEQSDEPFHLAKPDRALLLREVFAAHLREPTMPLEQLYDATSEDLLLRGQFPVGIFHAAARTLDLGILAAWRSKLGPLAAGSARRIAFGRASSPGAELRPALELRLSGERTIRLVGQTELMLVGARGSHTSIVPMLRKLEKKSAYHLRGALDHVVLAAAGLAPDGHAHRLIDPEGRDCPVDHLPWTVADARAYLTSLAIELLDEPHGYLLPLDALARVLAGGKPSASFTDPTRGLGYGPIERRDDLDVPPNIAAIAERRLAPLVDRMRGGEHGFENALTGGEKGRPPPAIGGGR
jgi:exodeoxyribonuclease V gamma subunit